MHKLTRTQVVVLNVSLMLVGLGIVAFGLTLVSNPFASGLLGSFGITLAATGSITLLDRLLTEKPALKGPELITMRRKSVPKSIHSRKETASKIDMLGISLTDFLAEIAKDRRHEVLCNVLNNTESRCQDYVHASQGRLFTPAFG